MKSPKLRNSSFLFVVFCLVGCRDKQELGFLGDIEVGKYEIKQYREYPSGNKDTLIYEAYGPYFQKSGRYYFDVHRNSKYYTSWEILENRLTFLSYNTITDEMRYYNSSIQSATSSNVILNYTYYVGGLGIVSDSASGHITFKRIPQ